MSSELVLFEAVAVGAIETLFDRENKPWFKRAGLGGYIGILDIARNFKGIKTTSRLEIMGQGQPLPRSGMRGGGIKPDDAFVNLDGALEIVVRSNKPKAVALVKWLVKKGVEKLQEEHQIQIEGKDAAIALLNDDLDAERHKVQDVSKQLVDLEHENHELQNGVERLQERYVPYLQDTRKDNGMAVIKKNNGDEYPYVAICGQQGYLAQNIQNKLAHYPNAQLVVLAETPNAIVHFNWLRERGCIIANPDRVRHFRLGEHYAHRQLMALQEV